jgi:integrase
MPGKQAKILSLDDVNDLLVFADCSRHPHCNRVIVLLAAKAGLRAGEIANLTWDMVLDPTGNISSVIELRDHAAKNGSGRLIPVHPDLCRALCAYRNRSTGTGSVIRSERGGDARPHSRCRDFQETCPAPARFIDEQVIRRRQGYTSEDHRSGSLRHSPRAV